MSMLTACALLAAGAAVVRAGLAPPPKGQEYEPIRYTMQALDNCLVGQALELPNAKDGGLPADQAAAAAPIKINAPDVNVMPIMFNYNRESGGNFMQKDQKMSVALKSDCSGAKATLAFDQASNTVTVSVDKTSLPAEADLTKDVQPACATRGAIVGGGLRAEGGPDTPFPGVPTPIIVGGGKTGGGDTGKTGGGD
eukprot:CAMPEP_0198315832 /NCGR_PEP_ID=MMETSP1450-20131203/5950_1 /TAXON_ID=753684 ORGANISM="Madagascaria erythrocladiodes, Strain CCMP3234" /NCGR_SAMPLE_ID=MMETSP1450 /ASSEMBLY_ACC=CAM_ASM_001115 /LENGTH=195 /DNA_ID=CAMNT_0044018957 /DNA_START=32 /DNA_END=616 /DNA_ORIENTATION=+